MLTIIHGNDVEAARAQLVALKKEATGREIREISGKKLDPAAFVQATESSSMFGTDVLVVGENILSQANKREKGFTKLVSAITEAAKAADVLLYEEKALDSSLLAKLGKSKVYEFKIPVLIFRFLDGLQPGHTKDELVLLNGLLATEQAEIVFAMLVRRVRQLVQLADRITPEGLADWQAARLTAQARFFTMDGLVAMHTKLVDIDVSIKTGTSPFTLTQLLEQFVLSI